MTTVQAFMRKCPVVTCYVLVFVISWGGILILVGPCGVPGVFTSDDKASLVLTGIVAGLAVGSFEELGRTSGARNCQVSPSVYARCHRLTLGTLKPGSVRSGLTCTTSSLGIRC